MSSIPYDWLTEIKQGIESLKIIPLWGKAPSFPMEAFAAKLKELFSIENISITCKDVAIRSIKEVKDDMGENPFTISLTLPPVKGEILWLLPSEDVMKLTSFGLAQKGISLTSQPLLEGFYKYVCLEIVHALETMPAYQGINFRLSHAAIHDKHAYVMDVVIKLDDQTLHGKLVISESFHTNWKSHFLEMKSSLLNSPELHDVYMPLHMQIGSTELSLEEWKKLSIGDFLILDRCSFDPETHKGNLSILLENVPLFQGRFKSHKIKIIDYAFYYEEENIMDEDMHSDSEFEHEEEFPEEEGSSEKTREKVEKILDTKDIKLPVHVEIGKVEISLQKLLQLKPGNLLELNLRPEEGVYLTVHGKKVARAELVKLGDLLGVKILEIGNKAVS